MRKKSIQRFVQILNVEYRRNNRGKIKKKRECIKNTRNRDFPGGTGVKNPPANAGDMGSIPALGRSHMPWSN